MVKLDLFQSLLKTLVSGKVLISVNTLNNLNRKIVLTTVAKNGYLY